MNVKTAKQDADVLIVGGGTGGCAAALGAAAMGCRVILTEETDWLGGQLTSQAVPPDEHRWIEQFGCTRRWRDFRESVRDYYRRHYPLLPSSARDPRLNPGAGNVSRLCHEPKVAVAVIEAMLACDVAAGRIRVMRRWKPVAAEVSGDRVVAVTLRQLDTGEQRTLTADYILDATELGDLLPLAGVEYVTGAESQSETGEPHAVAGEAQPENVQSFTWCFPLAFDPDPGADHAIEKPADYERWRDYAPKLEPAYTGTMLDWTHPHPHTCAPRRRGLFEHEVEKRSESLWLYRRIIVSHHYPDGAMPHEVTLVNWPQNDYWEGNLIDAPPEEVERYLEESRRLSLSLVYWLQTEAPRGDGGAGYPGLYLRGDLVGTDDGLAKYPYIRESRRIRAVFTVTENHVGADALKAQGKSAAERFHDSVGIGSYRIDLHPSTGGVNYIDISSQPFQIPLGALIPQRVENLLPACKNLGVTHITNGCYRLHPVEWNIGEAAGLVAGFCLARGISPRAVRERAELLEDFQKLLRGQGVELEWPGIHPV